MRAWWLLGAAVLGVCALRGFAGRVATAPIKTKSATVSDERGSVSVRQPRPPPPRWVTASPPPIQFPDDSELSDDVVEVDDSEVPGSDITCRLLDAHGKPVGITSYSVGWQQGDAIGA